MGEKMGKNSDGDEINEYERKYKENIKESIKKT